MSALGQGVDLIGALISNRLMLAVLTLCGMVLTVLGAFSLIDAVRRPKKLGRTGLPLLPIFDEVVIVRGIPRQPLEGVQGILPRVIGGIVTVAIAAVAFAIVVGIGYRDGVTGAILGAALGLGLGGAVALRPIMRWLARSMGLTLDMVLFRVIVNVATSYAGMVILYLLMSVVFLVAYLLIVAIWLILLPWLLFARMVRRLRGRPSRMSALLAPILFLPGLPSAVTKARRAGVWRDPDNRSPSARATRWTMGQSSRLQRYVLGLITGSLYALVGQRLVAAALEPTSEKWLLLSALMVFGVVAGRMFELAVESLFFDDFAGFTDYGPSTLNGLRVGLVTGLSFGTILGLSTNEGAYLHSFVDLMQSLVPAGVATTLSSAAFSLLLVLVPNLLGLIAPAFIEWLAYRLRHVHVRTGIGIGGAMLAVVGTALQMVQYFVSAR